MFTTALAFFNFGKYKYLYIIGIYVLTLMSFSIYYYYSQNEINQLKPFESKYEQLKVQYNKDIDTLNDKYNNQINAERVGFESYKKQCETLKKLGDVTKKAPTKVEKLINKASNNRIDCFAAATGDKDKVNDFCKDYYKK